MEKLETIASKLVTGVTNLSPEEREELVQYSTRQEIVEEHCQGLMTVLVLSLGKLTGRDRDNRGTEVLRYAARVKTHLKARQNPELETLCNTVLVYGVEDKEKGAAAEDEWFDSISKATGGRRVELIELLGNTKWTDVEKRLKRLKDIFDSDASSHEARVAIIDVVFGAMTQKYLEVEDGCLFYADLSLSGWTSPQLNRTMFLRLADLAQFGRMVNRIRNK